LFPWCRRELDLLVVPGLDVIQCTYCSHWSFTNPPKAGDSQPELATGIPAGLAEGPASMMAEVERSAPPADEEEEEIPPRGAGDDPNEMYGRRYIHIERDTYTYI